VDSKTWTDHVDLRPTINALLGLDDNYVDDGRVVTQVLDHKAIPKELDTGNATESLGASYKQINAPFGQFAMDTLVASTSALKSSDALHYDSVESSIANLTSKRNVLAGEIRQALNDAASGNARLDESQAKAWINQAQALLDQAHALAAANPA
jgi:outer membrane murein-binding lipoprotein Lpp